jgi:hypothetical protein
MSNLGQRAANGILTTNNFITPGTSLWVITFKPSDLSVSPDAEVWHGAAKGPGGYFLVYLDDSLYGVGENGLVSEYAPTTAMYFRDGQTITAHWSIGTGTAPRMWLYLREPEVGRI